MRRGLGLNDVGLFVTHAKEFVLGHVTKGATRRRENDATEAPFGDPLQALENGTVFAVGRELRVVEDG